MKNKSFYIVIISILSIILSTTSIFALMPDQNYYFYDYLDLELTIDGGFDIVQTSPGGQIQDARVELLLHPFDTTQQELITSSHDGTVLDSSIEFTWSEPGIGQQTFQTQSLVRIDNVGNRVRQKIEFPISNIENYLDANEIELYLQETQNVDWKNPKIIAKANELANGKDDLFDIVFTLASWVEENINYDLNTLTAQSSQSSSWVLDNKEGVCDEMTTLFIALSRSLGIPARFVTGVSYTTSDLFSKPWQAHGWAEVYFPQIGWVSFDPTFGEFGYVDVTHIKLGSSTDATNPSTRYEWNANNVELKANPLEISVEFSGFGKTVENEYSLENQIHKEIVNFGSYNLIKAIIKNENDFYVASRLMLAIPDEVAIIGAQKQTILLKPKEVKEVYWITKINEDLLHNYVYNFPYMIYTERNLTSNGEFSAQFGAPILSFEQIEELIPQEEDNSYARRITSSCKYDEYMSINSEKRIECTLKNTGNTQLENLDVCLDDVCQTIILPINQEYTTALDVSFDESGWKTFSLTAENSFVDKRDAITLGVLDDANIVINTTISKDISYGDEFLLTLTTDSTSFSIPKNIEVTFTIGSEKQIWNLDSLTQKEDLIIEMSSIGLGTKNEIEIESKWEDALGKEYKSTQVIEIMVAPNTFIQKIIMFFNGIFY